MQRAKTCYKTNNSLHLYATWCSVVNIIRKSKDKLWNVLNIDFVINCPVIINSRRRWNCLFVIQKNVLNEASVCWFLVPNGRKWKLKSISRARIKLFPSGRRRLLILERMKMESYKGKESFSVFLRINKTWE